MGFTNGCFALDCVPASNPAATTTVFNGLSFTNATFNVTTAGGFVSIDNPRARRTSTTSARSRSREPRSPTPESLRPVGQLHGSAGNDTATVLIKDTLTGVVAGRTTEEGLHRLRQHGEALTFGSGETAGSFDFFVNDGR